ncbi:hypothetical protein WDW86_03780 [Bdellovibrionota bacterium FG-2]
MWTGLFGNATAEKVLIFLEARGEGYALGIAKEFKLPVSQVQRQLQKFEKMGMVVTSKKGNSKVFAWNLRCAFAPELKALLRRLLSELPEEVREMVMGARQNLPEPARQSRRREIFEWD